MRISIQILIASLFSLTLLGACGPIQATSAIIKAEEAIRTAKLQDADKYAPYEYALSQEYLKMAKERQSFSEYEAGTVFAAKAQEAAEKAKEVAAKNLRLKKARETGVK